MSVRSVLGVLVMVVAVVAGGRAGLLAQAEPPKGPDILTVTLDGRVSTDNSHSGESGGAAANSVGQMSVNYRVSQTPVQMQLGASTGVRYDGAVGEATLVGANLGGSLGASLGKRSTVRANGNLGYVPSYSLVGNPVIPMDTLLENPGLLSIQSIDFSTVKRAAYSSGVSVSLSRQLTSHSTASLSFGRNETLFANATDPSVRSMNVRAGIQHQLTKHAGVHVGYGRRMAHYSSSPVDPSGARSTVSPEAVEDLDVGLDFTDGMAFTLWKNASLNFSTGSSITKALGERRHFNVTGTATFAYRLGKAGNVSAGYVRGVQILAGFGEPVFSDSASVQASERIGRWVQLSAATTYSLGNVGSAGPGRRYESLTGSARAGFQIGRNLSLYLQYAEYRHDLGALVDALRTIPRQQTRHSVVGGLTYNLSVVHQQDPRRPRVRE